MKEQMEDENSDTVTITVGGEPRFEVKQLKVDENTKIKQY